MDEPDGSSSFLHSIFVQDSMEETMASRQAGDMSATDYETEQVLPSIFRATTQGSDNGKRLIASGPVSFARIIPLSMRL